MVFMGFICMVCIKPVLRGISASTKTNSVQIHLSQSHEVVELLGFLTVSKQRMVFKGLRNIPYETGNEFSTPKRPMHHLSYAFRGTDLLKQRQLVLQKTVFLFEMLAKELRIHSAVFVALCINLFCPSVPVIVLLLL